MLLLVLQNPNNSTSENHEISPSSLGEVAAISKLKEHSSENDYDPRIDQENIDSIEDVYKVAEHDFDPSEYELKKLSDMHASLDDITSIRTRLQDQLHSVCIYLPLDSVN